MSLFTYVARRALSPGTVNLQNVTRDFRLLAFPLARRPQARQTTSLSGSVESILLRSETHYSCQTELIEPRTVADAQVLEFFASVENAEIFTFDRYGTIAVPDNPVSCLMVSKTLPTTESAKKFHRYRFVIRES